MDKFLEEQLAKWLPDYAGRKRNATSNSTSSEPSMKRGRTSDVTISQILDVEDDDDDVVMT